MSASIRRAFLAAVLAPALAACQPLTGSPSPAVSTVATAVSSPTPSSAPSSSVEASTPALVGQTETDWGRIWDRLPANFPRFAGSTPAEGATTGLASAVLAVDGVEAKTIADWMQSRLEAAAFTTDALSGPLEDGSFVLDSTGSAPGCRVQVSIAPLGALTVVTVRYGASCPEPR